MPPTKCYPGPQNWPQICSTSPSSMALLKCLGALLHLAAGGTIHKNRKKKHEKKVPLLSPLATNHPEASVLSFFKTQYRLSQKIGAAGEVCTQDDFQHRVQEALLGALLGDSFAWNRGGTFSMGGGRRLRKR